MVQFPVIAKNKTYNNNNNKEKWKSFSNFYSLFCAVWLSSCVRLPQ